MPPTIWEDWRTWVYHFSDSEGDVPIGKGSVEILDVKTHKGSTAFGNPSWHIVPCPYSPTVNGPSCVFVAYFIFSEGAEPGEAGVAAFVKELPQLASYSEVE